MCTHSVECLHGRRKHCAAKDPDGAWLQEGILPGYGGTGSRAEHGFVFHIFVMGLSKQLWVLVTFF